MKRQEIAMVYSVTYKRFKNTKHTSQSWQMNCIKPEKVSEYLQYSY